MAEGGGAAVDVDLVVGDAEVAHRDHRDAGEGLVDLEEVDLAGVPAGLRERLGDRADRGGGELGRLVGVGGVAHDRGATGLRPSLSATLWRVRTSAAAPSEIDEALAAVIVPSLAKAGFSVGIFAGVALGGLLVGVDDRVGALAAGDLDRDDLPRRTSPAPALPGRGSARRSHNRPAPRG